MTRVAEKLYRCQMCMPFKAPTYRQGKQKEHKHKPLPPKNHCDYPRPSEINSSRVHTKGVMQQHASQKGS